VKTYRCLFLTGIVALPMLLFAQTNPVPNPGFESWTAGNPDAWQTLNIPGVFVAISQSSTAHSGTSSVQGSVTELLGSATTPYLQSFFPVNSSFGTCTGWFTFSPVGGDSLEFTIVMRKNQIPIGVGSFGSSSTVGSFTQFSFPIEYFSPGPADSAWILVIISGADSVHLGSTFLLDDISLTDPTGVATDGSAPATFALGQNYPNPFNPSTTIPFDLPERSSVRLTVLNVLGQTVAELANREVEPGHSSLTWQASVPSGVYFYRLDAQSVSDPSRTFSSARRMVILK